MANSRKPRKASKKPAIAQLQTQAEELRKQAYDDSVEAGKTLADARDKATKAEELMREANLRLTRARKFEAIQNERQKKLDRAFVLLNRNKESLERRQYAADQRDLLIEENHKNY